MNRSINILLLLVSFPAMAFAIIVAFDITNEFVLPEGVEQNMRPTLIFGVCAIVLLLLVGRRSLMRWTGVSMTSKPEKFLWSTPIGRERMTRVSLYLIIEIVVAAFFTGICYWLTPIAWPITTVYGLLFLDQLLFLLIARKWFRVGITHKAVVVSDRELRVLYFSGLRRVEVQQQTLYFEYIEDLQLFFPVNCIPEGEFTAFRETLETRVDRNKVFFSEKFKALS
jgi:hypothetical protein